MQSELLKPCSPVSADAKLPIYIIRLELAHVATAINNPVSVIKTQPLGWPKLLTQRVLIWWYVTNLQLGEAEYSGVFRRPAQRSENEL